MPRWVGCLMALSCVAASACSDDTGTNDTAGDGGAAQDGGSSGSDGGTDDGRDATVEPADTDGAVEAGADAAAPDAAADAASDAAAPDAAGDGGAAASALAEYCPELHEAVCEWWKACRGLDDCTTGPVVFIATLCDDAAALGDSVILDADRTDACLELHAPPADPTDCQPGPPPLLSAYGFGPVAGTNACTGVLQSTGRLGDDCYPNDIALLDGCGEGYCARDGQCPGTCTAYGSLGESCTSVRCEPELYCGTGGTCLAYGGVGDPCTGGLRCARDLYCDASEQCAMRTAEGGACALDDAHCVSGLYCGALALGDNDGMCVQQRRLGGACSIDQGCDYPLRCVDNTCSDALAASGEPCFGGAQCPAGYNCHNGGSGPYTCMQAKPDGETCTYHTECLQDHVCSAIPADATYRCYAMGQEGEPCGPRGCGDYLYCEAGTCAVGSGEGGACDPDLGNCQQGLRCMDDAQCHPDGDAVGDPCVATDGSTCAEGLFCRLSDSTCALPAAQDEPCNPNTGGGCQAGLFCQQPSAGDATCQPRVPVGDACQDQECESGSYCQDGTCVLSSCRSIDP